MTCLPEEEFEKELHMSRTPIREALLRLEGENFLEVYPRKSIVVAPVTFDLLTEVYDMRRFVEPNIFKNACDRIPKSWLLKERDKFLNAPFSDDEMEEFNRYHENLDADFCNTVLQSASNRFVMDSMRLTYEHIQRICALTNRDPATVASDAMEHVAIIDAMLKNDKEAVFSLVTQHVESNRKKMFMHFVNIT